MGTTERSLPKWLKISHGIRALIIKLSTDLNMGDKKDGRNEIPPLVFNPNDPQSPYYLSSADNPGNIISPVVITGENYGNWSRIVVNTL